MNGGTYDKFPHLEAEEGRAKTPKKKPTGKQES